MTKRKTRSPDAPPADPMDLAGRITTNTQAVAELRQRNHKGRFDQAIEALEAQITEDHEELEAFGQEENDGQSA